MAMTQEKKFTRLSDIEGDFLTKDEVATILRTTVRTVERLISSGDLIAVKVGERSTVIDKKDFLNFIDGNKTKK